MRSRSPCLHNNNTDSTKLLFLSAWRHKNFPSAINYGTDGFFHLSSFIQCHLLKPSPLPFHASTRLQFPSFHKAKCLTFFFNLVTVKYLFSATICISSNLLFINTFILHTHLLKVTNIASSISDLTWPSLNHCFLLRCVGGGGAGNTLLILLSVTVPRALPSALTSLFLAQVLMLKLKGINVGPD